MNYYSFENHNYAQLIFISLSVPKTSLHRNESYSIHHLDHHLHRTSQPTPASLSYSSLDPHYDTISPEGQDAHDVIDHNHQDSDFEDEPVNPTPVRDESNKKGGGDREEPLDYEMPVVLQGVMDEECMQ